MVTMKMQLSNYAFWDADSNNVTLWFAMDSLALTLTSFFYIFFCKAYLKYDGMGKMLK